MTTERAARARRTFDAIDVLRDDPEVIVIRRQPTNREVRPHWVVSTAGHNSHHWHIDPDALLMVKVLMTQQEEDLP